MGRPKKEVAIPVTDHNEALNNLVETNSAYVKRVEDLNSINVKVAEAEAALASITSAVEQATDTFNKLNNEIEAKRNEQNDQLAAKSEELKNIEEQLGSKIAEIDLTREALKLEGIRISEEVASIEGKKLEIESKLLEVAIKESANIETLNKIAAEKEAVSHERAILATEKHKLDEQMQAILAKDAEASKKIEQIADNIATYNTNIDEIRKLKDENSRIEFNISEHRKAVEEAERKNNLYTKLISEAKEYMIAKYGDKAQVAIENIEANLENKSI